MDHVDGLRSCPRLEAMPSSDKRTPAKSSRRSASAARRKAPPRPKPREGSRAAGGSAPDRSSASRSGAVLRAWPVWGALCLLIIGTVGTISHNSDPSCSDHGGAIPREWADDVAHAAEVSALPPELVAAQLDVESRWDPEAESPVGAQGLAQFMPETWELYGEGEATDPEASIRAQGYYLRDLREMVAELDPADEQEETDLVLAAYNAGPTVVLEEGGIPEYQETQNYVDQITELSETRYAGVCSEES